MTAPALAAVELSKTDGDLPAAGPLDLTVARGERVVVLGHNGSGKTTFLRMAAGLLEPTAGTVSVVGHDVCSTEARAATSFLGDTPVFYDDLSVWEHLEYIARMHGVEAWHDRAEELLERLHLGERRDDIPTTFSRGLRQKAAIALGMVRPFDLLLVDEPFVGLDEPGKHALLGLLDESAAGGSTLVVATHELAFVQRVGRLLALRDGALVYDGAPGDAAVHALVLPS